MMDVNDTFSSGINFTFIEPNPQHRLNALLSNADKQRAQIHACPVQDVPVSTFKSLDANDVLFIGSSHIGKIGSDVLFLLFEVLPALGSGVIIHIHDIPWPFEYPEHWVEEGRAFNEAYMLRAFLQYNSQFEILFFNSYMARHHADLMNRSLPLAMRRPSNKDTEGNSSVWLRKR
jgi:hypothetical protein